MTEHATSDTHTPATAAGEPPFTLGEQKSFDADDAQAGRAIGKMLSLFFLYTILAMSIVAWWTLSSLD